jgi:hypothetical protein
MHISSHGVKHAESIKRATVLKVLKFDSGPNEIF